MRMRGPPRMPTHLKLLRGDTSHRPLNKNEPQPSVMPAPPPAPEFLTSHARDEWERIAEELYNLKLLTVVDVGPLAAYCQAYSTWRTAVEKLAEMGARDPVMAGLIVKTRHGSVMQNPLYLTMRQSALDMVRYATEFGFTPAARSRIDAADSLAPESKFGGLLIG